MSAVSYSQFFQQALYGPSGYYTQNKTRVGRVHGSSDFYTSSSFPLFGKLLAQAFRTLSQLHQLEDPTLIELGNEPNAEIFKETPEGFGGTFQFPLGALDQSHPLPPPRRGFVVEGAAPLSPLQTKKTSSFQNFSGPAIIFSNELFDAFAIDRLRKTKESWELLGLDVENKILDVVIKNDFAEERIKTLTALLPEDFPIGSVIDVSLDALHCIDKLFENKKDKQLFVAFDYGLTLGELLHQPRPTARAYRDHQALSLQEALALPIGSYDLTHHVVWDLIAERLRAHGLRVQPLMTQEAFFVHYAAGIFPALSPDDRRTLATLLHPSHMGSAFQVMIASR